jgi:hypothetical protein
MYCAVVEDKAEGLVDVDQEADSEEGVMETCILIYKADKIEHLPFTFSWEGASHFA